MKHHGDTVKTQVPKYGSRDIVVKQYKFDRLTHPLNSKTWNKNLLSSRECNQRQSTTQRHMKVRKSEPSSVYCRLPTNILWQITEITFCSRTPFYPLHFVHLKFTKENLKKAKCVRYHNSCVLVGCLQSICSNILQ